MILQAREQSLANLPSCREGRRLALKTLTNTRGSATAFGSSSKLDVDCDLHASRTSLLQDDDSVHAPVYFMSCSQQCTREVSRNEIGWLEVVTGTATTTLTLIAAAA